MVGNSIQTPLGELQVFLDGQAVEGMITSVKNNSFHPKSAKRYLIEICIQPDRREHILSCRLKPSQPVRSFVETGERCAGIIYHNEGESTFVLVGAEGDDYSPYYDYWLETEEADGLYVLSYQLCHETKTSRYIFGVMVAKIEKDEIFELSCYDVDPGCIGADDILEEL